MGRGLNRHFSKEEHRWPSGTWKDDLTSLIIREMQIKATVSCHVTLVRMTFIKKNTNHTCCWGCGEKGTILSCWCKLMQSLWKTIMKFLKIELPYDPATSLLSICLREVKAESQPQSCTPIFTAAYSQYLNCISNPSTHHWMSR